MGTSTVPLTLLVLSEATDFPPSKRVSAQLTLPTSLTMMLILSDSVQLGLWTILSLVSSCGPSATSSSQNGATHNHTMPAESREHTSHRTENKNSSSEP